MSTVLGLSPADFTLIGRLLHACATQQHATLTGPDEQEQAGVLLDKSPGSTDTAGLAREAGIWTTIFPASSSHKPQLPLF